MAGETPVDEPLDGGLAGRLARLRAEFEAAWAAAEPGGTMPDVEAFVARMPPDERPAARLMLEAVDDAAQARMVPYTEASAASGPAPDETLPTIPVPTEPGAGAPGPAPPRPAPPPPTAAEAPTLADDAGATLDLQATVAATGVHHPGLDRDEPPETMAMTGADATVDLASTVAFTPGPGRRMRPGPATSVGVPGYEILGELGRGGMGVVYKARQVRADRLVALKMVLAGAHASEEQLARFATEAQAVALIQHPGIVQVYDVGEHDGLPYFSLEFVEGGSLAHDVAGKPQPPRRAAGVVAELAEAMAEAHTRGVLHRDLKPANVLLTAAGRAKITDFGLAKKLEGDSEQTRSGAIMGTPSYMAPEQAFGQTKEIGPASDQYALGAILYEMLTGRPPFQGATALETLDLVRNQEPVPPRRLQPKVPADLETIALKALQKDPRRRYEDAAALAADLRRLLDGVPIQARPVSHLERTWSWCKRNPRIASLNAAVAGLVLAGLVGSTTAAWALNRKNNDLSIARADERRAKEEALGRADALKISMAAESAARAAENRATRTAQAQEKVAREAARKETAARKEEAAARGVADEARKVAEAEAEIARKGIESAFTQTRGSLETIRFLSILANDQLRRFPETREIRDDLLKTAGEELNRNMATLKVIAPLALDKTGNEAVAIRTMIGIHQRAGRLYLDVGRVPDCLREFGEMQDGAEMLLRRFPEANESLKVLAATSNTLGDFHRDHSDIDKALELYGRALELRRTWLDHASAGDEAETARHAVAINLRLVGNAWYELGDPAKARTYYLEEKDVRDVLKPVSMDILAARIHGAELHRMLGVDSMLLGDREAAILSLDKSLAACEAIATDVGARGDITQTRDLAMIGMGHVRLYLFDDPGPAFALYEGVLNDQRKRLAADPTNLTSKRDIAASEYYVGEACDRLGRPDDAAKHFDACLQIRKELAGLLKLEYAKMDLLIALARCGDHAEAAKIIEGLVSAPKLDNRIRFQVACGYSLCARAVLRGRPIAELPSDEAALAGRYLDGAFDSLRDLLARGWKGPVEIEIDPDLVPLHADPRFAPLTKEARRLAGFPART